MPFPYQRQRQPWDEEQDYTPFPNSATPAPNATPIANSTPLKYYTNSPLGMPPSDAPAYTPGASKPGDWVNLPHPDLPGESRVAKINEDGVTAAYPNVHATGADAMPRPYSAPEPRPALPPPYVTDVGGDPLLGGQGAAPVPSEPPTPPPVGLPTPQMSAPQAPPPPKQPGPPPVGDQEQALRNMVQMGPRKSTLGRIAAIGLGAAAGYVNAAGRSHVNLDQQRLDDMVNRNPMGKGSYSEGVARQQQLSQMEQAETKRKVDWENQQVKNETERKQGGFYDAHAASVTQDSATKAQAEKDKVKIEADKRATILKRQEMLNDQNNQQITIEEARKHNLYVSPEDIEAGYVIVDRRTYTPTMRVEATPDHSKRDINYWNSVKVSSAPGSAERKQAEEAIKGLEEYAAKTHPVKPARVDADKELTRKARGYVGGLEAKYNDWAQVEAAIRADKAIDDNTRAAALDYALKMKRSGRDPKSKDDWIKEASALFGAPQGGGRGGPAPGRGGTNPAPTGPPVVDPLGIRK